MGGSQLDNQTEVSTMVIFIASIISFQFQHLPQCQPPPALKQLCTSFL